MAKPTNGRDERALEALLSLAFLEDVIRQVPTLEGPEPELDPADQEALDALGPDLVGRILREESMRSGRPMDDD